MVSRQCSITKEDLQGLKRQCLQIYSLLQEKMQYCNNIKLKVYFITQSCLRTWGLEVLRSSSYFPPSMRTNIQIYFYIFLLNQKLSRCAQNASGPKSTKWNLGQGFLCHTGHTKIFLLCNQLHNKAFWFTIFNLTVINEQWW